MNNQRQNNQATSKILNAFRASLPVVSLESSTVEEQNTVEDLILNVAMPLRQAQTFVWDLASGLREAQYDAEKGVSFSDVEDYAVESDPILDLLDYIDQKIANKPAVFILLDFHPYLSGQRQDLQVLRKIKNLCFCLKRSFKRMVLLSQDAKLPSDLEGLVQEVSYDLPNYNQIKNCFETAFLDFQNKGYEVNISDWDKLVRSSQGLTLEEVRDCVRVSIIANGRIDSEGLSESLSDKKIHKLQKLNVDFSVAPDVQIGGLSNFKEWLKIRTKLFTAQSSNLNLPTPKGVLLVGVPGTGKSLAAKTIGSIWNCPILRLDMGSVYGSLVGESESNMRKILETAEAIAPCVLHIDELEKALSGVGGASTDSGVSQRVFGTFLTWMQDKTAPVFVVATANDISKLPPELSRKGRFDEVFFVDLPTETERQEILQNHINKRIEFFSEVDVDRVAESTEGYSGSELADIIESAVIAGFAEDRLSTTEDILSEVDQVVPLSQRDSERIKALRNWANNSARFANQRERSSQQQNSKGSREVQLLS